MRQQTRGDGMETESIPPREAHSQHLDGLTTARHGERPPVLLRLYPALANPHFRLFWLGMLPAVLAFQMNMVAAPYATFLLAGNATVLGLISLAMGLPMMLLSLVGGVVADHFPRRRVMIASQVLLLTVAACLAGLSLSGSLQVWHILALSFMQGTAFSFNMPARQAYLGDIVERHLIRSAVTLNNAGMNFTRVAGPAVAGVLISLPFVGIGGVFLTMTVMYSIVVISLFRLPAVNRPHAGGRPAGGWAQMMEGLRYVRSSRVLLALLAMAFLVTLFGMPFQTLMPVFAERIFEAGPEGLGALTAATGLGAFVGSLVVASLSRASRPALMQLGFGVGFGLSLVAFAVSPSFPLAICALIAVGFLSAAFAAINNTLVMTNTQPNLYGRVMSIYMLSFASMPLGAMPLAWLADLAGARTAVFLSGVLVTAAVGAIALLYPAYRHIK